MTSRGRIQFASVLVGGSLVLSACTAAAAPATRAGVPVANVIATATVKAGGTPGGSAGGAPSGSPGAQLFAAQGCSACHTVQGQGGAIGPNLSTVGTVAGTRKPGTSAADYIKESIVNPSAFVVPGYATGIMPTTFAQTLTPAQIDELVAYLLEQK